MLVNVDDERLSTGELLMQWRDATRAAELAQWGVDHCPVCNALERAVPITVEIATN